MPIITLSTGSLYTYGIARVFDLAAEAGFEAIEVLIDQRWDSRQPSYLRRLSEKTGLPILAVHNPFKPAVPGWPHESLGRLRETVAVAQEVGAGVVVAHLPLRIRWAMIELFGFRRNTMVVPIPMGGAKEYRDFLLNGLAEFEADVGLKIGIENMPVKNYWGHKVDIHWLTDLETWSQMPHLTLDTTHIGTREYNLLAIYERIKSRMVHVHLSNFNGKEHRRLEDGNLPLAKLLARMQQDGFEGAVSLEMAPEALEAEDEGQVRAHLQRMVAYCRECMDS